MLFGGPLWAGFIIGSSDSMGPGKTQYTTKYARNAVFDKVLIKNDFPCISQFVFLLFELLLQPFWSLSGEFFCAGCYKQGLKLHKKTSGETKNRNCSMNSSSPPSRHKFSLNPVIPHLANTFNPDLVLFLLHIPNPGSQKTFGHPRMYMKTN